jgi:hypothetical protein
LIEENKTLEEICELRSLKEGTIISHIMQLAQNSYISNEIKDNLLSDLINEFPKEIKSWIEEGLKIAEIEDLRQNIYKYSYLFN